MVGFLAFLAWAVITAGTGYMIWLLIVKGQKACTPATSPACETVAAPEKEEASQE